ncbi:MAG: hypothetical protein JXQ73_13090 [Phycisphaerae bacterium]|nr:hypothetical protein [Phycisphaerae bacterium]
MASLARMRLSVALLVVTAGVGFFCAPVLAQTTLYVDDDAAGDAAPGDPNVGDPLEDGSSGHPFDAIQEALDRTSDGDEVVVLPGRYTGVGNRGVVFPNRAVTVRSVDPNDPNVVAGTVVDCEGADRGFSIVGGQGRETVVAGLTIANGSGDGGGAILCVDSSPTIDRCVMTRCNSSLSRGGGVKAVGGSAKIMRCRISSTRTGGGMELDGGEPLVIGCELVENMNSLPWEGVLCKNGCHATIVNTIIAKSGLGFTLLRVMGDGSTVVAINCALIGCRLYAADSLSGADLTLRNCIAWGAGRACADRFFVEGGSSLSVSYCVIMGGEGAVTAEPGSSFVWGPGNVDVDPMWTPGGRLRPGSPCINAGDPSTVADPNFPTDIDGDERVLAGRVDIGPDEFLDSDGDDLPDVWERFYFGSATGADPNGDPDGDGLTNRQECLQFGGDPKSVPVYVAVGSAAGPLADGSAQYPFETIQQGIDAAPDGGTVLVQAGTYRGAENKQLFLQYTDYPRSVIVRAVNGPAATAIDCEDEGPGISPLWTGRQSLPALVGFTITGGRGTFWRGGAGGVDVVDARMMLKECVLEGNVGVYFFGWGPVGPTGGGISVVKGEVSIDGVTFRDNEGTGGADAGNIGGAIIQLLGDLTIENGAFVMEGSRVCGPGRIVLLSEATLESRGAETIITSVVSGSGRVVVASSGTLTFGGQAVLDLSGSGSAPDGRILVEGTLIARDRATIQHARLDVKDVYFADCRSISYNDIRLHDRATEGGQFFVAGSPTIAGNRIVSEGDRYLDLWPDPGATDGPTITNNAITVLIKANIPGAQGTLLELRALDYDAGTATNPEGRSGVFHAPSSAGFTSDPSANWVLESLRVEPGAKVTLTNRQGFVYQSDVTHPETVYVKELVLFPNSVLNTGLQTLYYRDLKLVAPQDGNDPNHVEDPNYWTVLAENPDPQDANSFLVNGSRIVDVPLLGFSLGIIRMEDDYEFSVRVAQRITDPADADPNDPNEPLPEGSILRREGLVANRPQEGVMEMRTGSSPSVRAKGAFARAAEDWLTVLFQYKFAEDAYGQAELVVSLSDDPRVGVGNREVARIRPPRVGRRGSLTSDSLAVFWGRYRRGELDFTRGTYVELELRGAGSSCWIDNWDPQISCSDDTCGNLSDDHYVTAEDYLLLLAAVTSQDPLSMDPNGSGQIGCLDLNLDSYIDLHDLLNLDGARIGALTLCDTSPLERASLPESDEIPEPEGDVGGAGEVLVVACKPGGREDAEDALCALDPVTGGMTWFSAASGDYYANGRVCVDGLGRVYQLHATRGLVRQVDGVSVVPYGRRSYVQGESSVEVEVGARPLDSGLPILDAAFDPCDSNVVYVVPVVVDPEGSRYRAGARLRLRDGSGYDVEAVYGGPPELTSSVVPSEPGDGETVSEPDYGHVREIEVDGYGNVYVLSALALNGNDWLLVYDGLTGELSPEEGAIDLSEEVSGPTALLVSRHDASRLYVASSVNAPTSDRTRVHRFRIARDGSNRVTGLAMSGSDALWRETLEIVGMRHVTSMTEDPSTGALYVVGVMSATLGPSDPLPSEVFTEARLAVIGAGEEWSDPNGVVRTVSSTGMALTPGDPGRGLPVSAVYVKGMGLRLEVGNNHYGEVLVEPNFSRYLYGTWVRLEAVALGDGEFKRWRIYDPNHPGDGNHALEDTNDVLTVEMTGDVWVDAEFTCGGQVLPPVLGALGVMLGFGWYRRRGRV